MGDRSIMFWGFDFWGNPVMIIDARSDEVRSKDLTTLAQATLRKHRSERKVMHEMLTEAGIPEFVAADGVRTCLIGRLAVALARLEEMRNGTGT